MPFNALCNQILHNVYGYEAKCVKFVNIRKYFVRLTLKIWPTYRPLNFPRGQLSPPPAPIHLWRCRCNAIYYYAMNERKNENEWNENMLCIIMLIIMLWIVIYFHKNAMKIRYENTLWIIRADFIKMLWNSMFIMILLGKCKEIHSS